MSGIFRAVKRAIGLLVLTAALAGATAAAFWWVLGNVGIQMPFPTVLTVVVLLVVWITVTSGRGDQPVASGLPSAGPPRPRPTWEDCQRMAVLQRQGLISRDELDRALSELIPPPVAPPSGRRAAAGRR
jgi:hypothetical protein